jgi:hypothetical protein
VNYRHTGYADWAAPLHAAPPVPANLDHLFGYPNATPGQVENVYETLSDPDRFPETAAAQRAVDTVDKPNSGLPTVPTAPTTTTEGIPPKRRRPRLGNIITCYNRRPFGNIIIWFDTLP